MVIRKFNLLPSSDRLAQYVNKGNARDFEKTNEWIKGTYSINHISLIESNQRKDRLTYSISGGKDRQWFEFDSNYSGKLMFINAPDFEEPLDIDRLNEYEVKISVSMEVLLLKKFSLLVWKMKTRHPSLITFRVPQA